MAARDRGFTLEGVMPSYCKSSRPQEEAPYHSVGVREEVTVSHKGFAQL